MWQCGSLDLEIRVQFLNEAKRSFPQPTKSRGKKNPRDERPGQSVDNKKLEKLEIIIVKRYGLGGAYDLRHCFARRCLEIGLTSDVSAKLMGHSREIHERTYRAWIKSSVYVDAAKRAIAKL